MIPDEARITEAQSESLHNALIASCDEFVPPIHLPDEARIAALEAENTRLREALKPFVEGHAHTTFFLSRKEAMHFAGRQLYAEDVERARAVLNKGGPDAA